MKRVVIMAAILVMVLVVQGVPPACAEEGTGAQVGWGLATVGSNILYVPSKLVYAGVGGLTGGMAYVLTAGNRESANNIWRPSMGGTYLLTPPMVRGEEPIMFSGRKYEE